MLVIIYRRLTLAEFLRVHSRPDFNFIIRGHDGDYTLLLVSWRCELIFHAREINLRPDLIADKQPLVNHSNLFFELLNFINERL